MQRTDIYSPILLPYFNIEFWVACEIFEFSIYIQLSTKKETVIIKFFRFIDGTMVRITNICMYVYLTSPTVPLQLEFHFQFIQFFQGASKSNLKFCTATTPW